MYTWSKGVRTYVEQECIIILIIHRVNVFDNYTSLPPRLINA